MGWLPSLTSVRTTSSSQGCSPQPVSKVATTGRRPVTDFRRSGRRADVRHRLPPTAAAGTVRVAGHRRASREPGAGRRRGVGRGTGLGSRRYAHRRRRARGRRAGRRRGRGPERAARWSSTHPSGALVASLSLTVRSSRDHATWSRPRRSSCPRRCASTATQSMSATSCFVVRAARVRALLTVTSQPRRIGLALERDDRLLVTRAARDEESWPDVHRRARLARP